MGVLAAPIWHFWLAIPLTVLAVVAVVATIIGYVKQVVMTRYPPK